MSSIHGNIFWNLLRVCSNVFFPILVLPYLNRVLGPYNIGLYNYISAIVAYFVLFSSFGFPLYGVRAVAINIENKEKLQILVSGIFTANFFISCVIFFIYILFFLTGIVDSFKLYLIIGSLILMNAFGFEWFFQGIEDFKYITIRTVLVKVLSIFFLFLYVKNQNDILVYATISSFSILLNNLLNYFRLKSFVALTLSFDMFIYHIRKATPLFLSAIFASLYTQINSLMLGYLGNIMSVAFYTTADKFIQLCVQITSAISFAVMPRISKLKNSNQEKKEAVALQKKSLSFLLFLTIPMFFYLFFFADDIILVFAGEKFIESILILRYLSVLVIIIPISIYFAFHILFPIGKEKYSNYCTICASLICFILNLHLIPVLFYKGVIISVIASEVIVFILHLYFSRKFIDLYFSDFLNFKVIISSFFSSMIVNNILIDNHFICLAMKSLSFSVCYLIFLWLLKEKNCTELINLLLKKE